MTPAADELRFTPLELIDCIAALVPPPRTHRHRYFGVPAPNSPLRAAVMAITGEGVPGMVPLGHAMPSHPRPNLPHPSAHRRTTCGRC